MGTEESKYDMFSQMTLDELIQNEKSALSFLNSSSKFLVKEAKNDLNLIRQVMRAVHSFNWINRKVSTSMEYKTIDTRTLKGLKQAESLRESGWIIYRTGLFLIYFMKKIDKLTNIALVRRHEKITKMISILVSKLCDNGYSHLSHAKLREVASKPIYLIKYLNLIEESVDLRLEAKLRYGQDLITVRQLLYK